MHLDISNRVERFKIMKVNSGDRRSFRFLMSRMRVIGILGNGNAKHPSESTCKTNASVGNVMNRSGSSKQPNNI